MIPGEDPNLDFLHKPIEARMVALLICGNCRKRWEMKSPDILNDKEREGFEDALSAKCPWCHQTREIESV